jgi:hypothetical protein
MPAFLADGYGVLCQVLEMLELNACLCHSVIARCRLRVVGCVLQVARCVNATCIIY